MDERKQCQNMHLQVHDIVSEEVNLPVLPELADQLSEPAAWCSREAISGEEFKKSHNAHNVQRDTNVQTEVEAEAGSNGCIGEAKTQVTPIDLSLQNIFEYQLQIEDLTNKLNAKTVEIEEWKSKAVTSTTNLSTKELAIEELSKEIHQARLKIHQKDIEAKCCHELTQKLETERDSARKALHQMQIGLTEKDEVICCIRQEKTEIQKVVQDLKASHKEDFEELLFENQLKIKEIDEKEQQIQREANELRQLKTEFQQKCRECELLQTQKSKMLRESEEYEGVVTKNGKDYQLVPLSLRDQQSCRKCFVM